MKWIPIDILGFATDESDRSLWSDIRRGQAGFLVRIGLSVASGLALIACFLCIGGVIETRSTQGSDEAMILGLGVVIVLWIAALYWIWSSYRRWRHALRTAFSVLIVWAVALPLMFVLYEFIRSDLVMVACTLMAIAATILLVSVAFYMRHGGNPIMSAAGVVHVRCPECGYSLVGLSSCECPECGLKLTIDQLIKAQDYGAVKASERREATLPSLPLRQSDDEATVVVTV